MPRHPRLEQLDLLLYIGKWFVIACIVATMAGSASALFLLTLDHATRWREAHPTVIWLLPFAGMFVGLVYHLFGKEVDAGNNLVIEEIHNPKKVVPLRMAPLVLGGTVISHLFGASVGREGTAVQMGASLADQLTPLLRLRPENRRILLMTGISAGFASVFGTPLAGALFGLEVLAIGRMRYDALFPCALAAIVADQIGMAWGIHHTHYSISSVPPLSVMNVLAVMAAGVIFGLVALAFSTSMHKMSARVRKLIPYAPLRPFFGGLLVATAIWALDGYRYIGIGIPSIVQSFQVPMAPWDFLGKFGFTVASLSTGFKGGEVTPLFYIGTTLGNVLAPVFHLPFPVLAGIGFVAVFAGAANTPITTIVMAVELFGPDIGPLAAVGCVASFLVSGHTGIYHAQRIGHGKHHRLRHDGLKISEVHAAGLTPAAGTSPTHEEQKS